LGQSRIEVVKDEIIKRGLYGRFPLEYSFQSNLDHLILTSYEKVMHKLLIVSHKIIFVENLRFGCSLVYLTYQNIIYSKHVCKGDKYSILI